jgi:hypothetical protein
MACEKHEKVQPLGVGRLSYRLLLTATAIVVALSGADSWSTAAIVVGSGLGLDVLRMVLPWSRVPPNLLDEIIRVSALDRPIAMQKFLVSRIVYYPAPAIFVLIGLAYAWLVPIHPTEQDMPPADLFWIFHVSHLCRKFVVDLNAHGYSERAKYLPAFFGIMFAAWFAYVTVAAFIVPRSAALEWAWTYRDRVLHGRKANDSYGFATFLFFFISASGFLAANNLSYIVWINPLPDEAVYKSNFFFPFYGLGMGLLCAMVPNIGAPALLYSVGFQRKNVIPQEDAVEQDQSTACIR